MPSICNRLRHITRSNISYNSKTKILLNLEPDEAKYVRDVLRLTPTEVRAVTRFERGEALISANNNKVPVVIKASREEQELITTDRAELEAILRQRQQEQSETKGEVSNAFTG